jgi:lipoyl(octanoyl) transferase
MNPPVQVHHLGRVEYVDGLELQRQFTEARRAKLVDDTLLLLEHPPVLTLGRGAEASNILASPARLAELGVEVHETDRGGDVTYHGPGQLVGYPLLHLGPGRQDVRRYVRCIEEIIIRTVADFGVTATRIEKWPGVWVEHSRAGGPRKICALGVHLSRWYTRHGFALNVQTNLSHFELIVPCGISEAGVTSLEHELDRAVPVAEVEARVVRHFAEVFECEVRQAPAPVPTVGVVIAQSDQYLLLRRTPARGGFWQPVTGHIEAGESPAQAAARELREETGFTVDVGSLEYVHAFPWGQYQPPKLGREHAFVARVESKAPSLGDEHDAFEWVDLPTALERVPFAGFKRALALAAKR